MGHSPACRSDGRANPTGKNRVGLDHRHPRLGQKVEAVCTLFHLACTQGHGGHSRQQSQCAPIIGLHGFFQPRQIQRFGLARKINGRLQIPTAVGIGDQLGLGADGRPYGAQAHQIRVHAAPLGRDQHLDALCPGQHLIRAGAHQRIGFKRRKAASHMDRCCRARRPQHRRHALPRTLARQIPQRNVQSRQGRNHHPRHRARVQLPREVWQRAGPGQRLGHRAIEQMRHLGHAEPPRKAFADAPLAIADLHPQKGEAILARIGGRVARCGGRAMHMGHDLQWPFDLDHHDPPRCGFVGSLSLWPRREKARFRGCAPFPFLARCPKSWIIFLRMNGDDGWVG